MGARDAVFEGLLRVQKGGFSNLVFDTLLKKHSLESRERAFACTLYYGVLERRLTLDAIIAGRSEIAFGKLEPQAVVALEIGLYQLLYMGSVPDRAAVDETVELCKKARLSRMAGFVNAILRGFVRDGKKLPERGEGQDEAAWLSVCYSFDEELARLLLPQMGEQRLAAFLERALQPPALYLRVNTLKTSTDELLGMMAQEGVEAVCCEAVDHCVYLPSGGEVTRLPGFAQGLFYVQDISSQLCAAVLDARPGQTVLDCCSAPGSKAFTIAQWMNNTGLVDCWDLHPKRVRLIQDGACKYGLSILSASACDASEDHPQYNQTYDRVLCDVPCSGLGVIASKPEVKYKNIKDLIKLPKIQERILCAASNYVKLYGSLVYSTCTVNREENQQVVERFLRSHPHFALEPFAAPYRSFADETGAQALLLGEKIPGDGFFIAKMKRVG